MKHQQKHLWISSIVVRSAVIEFHAIIESFTVLDFRIIFMFAKNVFLIKNCSFTFHCKIAIIFLTNTMQHQWQSLFMIYDREHWRNCYINWFLRHPMYTQWQSPSVAKICIYKLIWSLWTSCTMCIAHSHT